MSTLDKLTEDRCYIIAEIGGNFTRLEDGLRLIDAAAQCGVDAVKLQTYRAETLASRHALFDQENTGVISQFDLFREYEVDRDTHAAIAEHAAKLSIDWFSTPSHQSDVDMLESLNVCAHKIGSDDAVNLPFLEYVAETGKPIFLSTGMCTLNEVRASVECILGTGNTHLSILHAITSYPTHPEDVNLRAMKTIADEFAPLAVGYSDHTLGPVACLAAVAMGAGVIEKHFTLDTKLDGPDHMLSADPAQMTALVESIRLFERMRGDGIKRPVASEKKTRVNNRKSMVVTGALSAGDVLSREILAVKRPGYGIEPRYFEQLIGRRVLRDLSADEVLRWDDLG